MNEHDFENLTPEEQHELIMGALENLGIEPMFDQEVDFQTHASWDDTPPSTGWDEVSGSTSITDDGVIQILSIINDVNIRWSIVVYRDRYRVTLANKTIYVQDCVEAKVEIAELLRECPMFDLPEMAIDTFKMLINEAWRDPEEAHEAIKQLILEN